MEANDNAGCEHEFEPSLYETGLDVCAWCGETREAEPVVVEGRDVPRGAVVVDALRRAA